MIEMRKMWRLLCVFLVLQLGNVHGDDDTHYGAVAEKVILNYAELMKSSKDKDMEVEPGVKMVDLRRVVLYTCTVSISTGEKKDLYLKKYYKVKSKIEHDLKANNSELNFASFTKKHFDKFICTVDRRLTGGGMTLHLVHILHLRRNNKGDDNGFSYITTLMDMGIIAGEKGEYWGLRTPVTFVREDKISLINVE